MSKKHLATAAAFPSHGAVYASSDEVATARQRRNDRQLARSLVTRIVSGSIPFPLKRHFTSLEQVRAWFRRLQTLPFVLSTAPYIVHGYYGTEVPAGVALPSVGAPVDDVHRALSGFGDAGAPAAGKRRVPNPWITASQTTVCARPALVLDTCASAVWWWVV